MNEFSKYILGESVTGRWATKITNSSYHELSPIRSKARIFSQAEIEGLTSWIKQYQYEVVEIGEDEWLRRQGEDLAPRLPGF